MCTSAFTFFSFALTEDTPVTLCKKEKRSLFLSFNHDVASLFFSSSLSLFLLLKKLYITFSVIRPTQTCNSHNFNCMCSESVFHSFLFSLDINRPVVSAKSSVLSSSNSVFSYFFLCFFLFLLLFKP